MRRAWCRAGGSASRWRASSVGNILLRTGRNPKSNTNATGSSVRCLQPHEGTVTPDEWGLGGLSGSPINRPTLSFQRGKLHVRISESDESVSGAEPPPWGASGFPFRWTICTRNTPPLGDTVTSCHYLKHIEAAAPPLPSPPPLFSSPAPASLPTNTNAPLYLYGLKNLQAHAVGLIDCFS